MQRRHDSCTTKFPGPPVTLKKARVSNRRSGSRCDGDICARDVSALSCVDSSLRLFHCRRTHHAPGHLSQETAPASSCGGDVEAGPSCALIPLLRFPSSGCRGTECSHHNGVTLCPCGPHTFSSDSPGPALGELPGMTKMTEQILNWLSQLRAVNGFEFGSLNMDDADSERSGLAGFNYSKKPAPLP